MNAQSGAVSTGRILPRRQPCLSGLGIRPIRMLAALSILGPHTVALYAPWHI